MRCHINEPLALDVCDRPDEVPCCQHKLLVQCPADSSVNVSDLLSRAAVTRLNKLALNVSTCRRHKGLVSQHVNRQAAATLKH